MAVFFQMCAREQAVLKKYLAENFDLEHFRESMEICPATSQWLERERAAALSTLSE
jgi:hypothetical protein